MSVAQDERISPNRAPAGGVYELVDPKTGKTEKVGRSSDLRRRASEHRRDNKGLEFRPLARTDDLNAQAGLEQHYHDLRRDEGHPLSLDKASPIAPNHPSKQMYADRANDYLSREGVVRRQPGAQPERVNHRPPRQQVHNEPPRPRVTNEHRVSRLDDSRSVRNEHSGKDVQSTPTNPSNSVSNTRQATGSPTAEPGRSYGTGPRSGRGDTDNGATRDQSRRDFAVRRDGTDSTARQVSDKNRGK